MECESYKWTEGGNFPSAKISTANEAILFLSKVESEKKMLVLQDDFNDLGKSLTKTYVDRYGPILGNVEVWSYVWGESLEQDKVTIVREVTG